MKSQNPNVAELVRTAQRAGYTVYMGSPNDSWFHYTDGKNIGYAQFNTYDGAKLCTVHKPSQQVGTGFRVDGCDKLAFKAAAIILAPNWASSHDLKCVRKWESFEAFRKAYWRPLVEVGPMEETP